MTTKKFNPTKANLTEFNRELKRLASRKCRAKTDSDKKKAEAEYKKLAKLKAEKFETAKKSYMSYTKDEIAKLNLETTIKAIKSLQSTRCLYPERKAEVLKVEAIYQTHRTELTEKAQFEELKKKFNK